MPGALIRSPATTQFSIAQQVLLIINVEGMNKRVKQQNNEESCRFYFVSFLFLSAPIRISPPATSCAETHSAHCLCLSQLFFLLLLLCFYFVSSNAFAHLMTSFRTGKSRRRRRYYQQCNIAYTPREARDDEHEKSSEIEWDSQNLHTTRQNN